MKIDLDHWSDAELDLLGAQAVLSTLEEAMFADQTDKVYQDTVMGARRLIESALAWIECGKYPDSTRQKQQ